MIRQILHQLDSHETNHQTCVAGVVHLVPYASVMRWRQRQRSGTARMADVPAPRNQRRWTGRSFIRSCGSCITVAVRTQGTGKLYEQFARLLSRRQLVKLVQDYRRDQLPCYETHSMALVGTGLVVRRHRIW